jgi:hypothetical protein
MMLVHIPESHIIDHSGINTCSLNRLFHHSACEIYYMQLIEGSTETANCCTAGRYDYNIFHLQDFLSDYKLRNITLPEGRAWVSKKKGMQEGYSALDNPSPKDCKSSLSKFTDHYLFQW